MTDELHDLLERALEAQAERDRERDWRRGNPYVLHLIEVLLRDSGSDGLPRRKAIEAVERVRRAKGLPMPSRFDETAQSAFNQHCVRSNVFRRRNAPDDGLFLSRRVGNTAIWVVDRECAARWLARQRVS
jgi:hypothetical protein